MTKLLGDNRVVGVVLVGLLFLNAFAIQHGWYA